MARGTAPGTLPDSSYAFEPVPLLARRGFWSVGFVMLGFTFFSASMSVGAKLGNGLDLGGFVAATLIGGGILALYTGALAFLGARTGMGLDLLAQRAFGQIGSLLPSALIAFTQMGWFGVGVAMLGIPVAQQLGMSPWWIIGLAGAGMTISAVYGIKAIEIVSYISVPLIALLGTYSMVSATTTSGGLTQVFGDGTMPLVAAIGMVVGSFISGGSTTPNFTRFAATTRSAVITTVIAFFLGNTLMFSFGAVGGAFTGKDDIFYVMIAQGLAIPAILVLGANIWTTNNNALYSTGLGLSNITRLHTRPMTLIAGIAGTLASLWLYDNFVGWLSFLSAALPPIGAILITDYLLRRNAYPPAPATAAPPAGAVTGAGPAGIMGSGHGAAHIGLPEHTIVWPAALGVIAGGLVGFYVPWGIAPVNAMVVAATIHLVGTVLSRKGRGA